eukprot:5106681-Prymnesium_polylepis.1
MDEPVGELDDSDDETDAGALANGLLISAVCGLRGGAESPSRMQKATNTRGQPIKAAWEQKA